MDVREIRLKLGIAETQSAVRWAIVCGDWAAHQCVPSYPDPSEWCVTHVPSGYRVPPQVIGEGLRWHEAAAVAQAFDRQIGAFEVDRTAGNDRWRLEAAAGEALAEQEGELVSDLNARADHLLDVSRHVDGSERADLLTLASAHRSIANAIDKAVARVCER